MVHAINRRLKQRYARGVELFDRGEYEKAIREFQSVVNSANESVPERRLAAFYMGEAYTNLGLTHLHMRMYRRAEAEIRLALTIHPDYADLHCELARIQYEQGRYADAAEGFSRAVAINPAFAKALMYLGMSKVRAGCAEGLDLIRRAGEIQPAYRDPRCDAARLFFEDGNIRRAVGLLEQVARADVDQIGYLEETALQLMEARKFREAIPFLVEAVSVCPNYADLRCHLAKCYMHERMMDMAQGQFMEALRINPGFAVARMGLAACREHKRSDTAAAELHGVPA